MRKVWLSTLYGVRCGFEGNADMLGCDGMSQDKRRRSSAEEERDGLTKGALDALVDEVDR